MKKFIVLFKDKDSTTISMLTDLSLSKANKIADKLRKSGASGVQVRMRTNGLSSVRMD